MLQYEHVWGVGSEGIEIGFDPAASPRFRRLVKFVEGLIINRPGVN